MAAGAGSGRRFVRTRYSDAAAMPAVDAVAPAAEIPPEVRSTPGYKTASQDLPSLWILATPSGGGERLKAPATTDASWLPRFLKSVTSHPRPGGATSARREERRDMCNTWHDMCGAPSNLERSGGKLEKCHVRGRAMLTLLAPPPTAAMTRQVRSLWKFNVVRTGYPRHLLPQTIRATRVQPSPLLGASA